MMPARFADPVATAARGATAPVLPSNADGRYAAMNLAAPALYPSYYVGVDLGRVVDHTAIVILEEGVWVRDEGARETFGIAVPIAGGADVPSGSGGAGVGWLPPAALVPQQLAHARQENWQRGRPLDPPLAVRWLERIPLGTPYHQVIARVAALRSAEPLVSRPTALLVDESGVGGGVIEDFYRVGLAPFGITITAGHTPTASLADQTFHTPKRDLIGAAQNALQRRRLTIAPALPDAAALREELANFRVTIGASGHDRYEAGGPAIDWRQGGAHDDLVLALAMCVWTREWWCGAMEQDHARRQRPTPPVTRPRFRTAGHYPPPLFQVPLKKEYTP